MRFKDRTVHSVADALSALKQQSKVIDTVWFRGQSDSKWKLIPSLARNQNHLRAENALIKKFQQNAAPHLDRIPDKEWEWMFLMQHHRAPTRLLDWSESPLIALYFALGDKRNEKKDGAVWCLDPVSLNRAEANLTFDGFPEEIPAFGIDSVLDNYLPTHVNGSTNTLSAVAVMGPRNTPRMAAQLGVFTINHRNHSPLENLGKKSHVWRWTVPAVSKKTIRRDLKLLGFTALTVFPELDRVADVATELLV